MFYRNLPILQKGTVLLLAMVFMALAAMIAVAAMSTSILSLKISANVQMKEDAMQMAEGISNQLAAEIIALLDRGHSPLYENFSCESVMSGIECDIGQDYLVLSNGLSEAARNSDLHSHARIRSASNRSAYNGSRMMDDEASSALLSHFIEVEGVFNGNKAGLAKASLTIGILNNSLASSGAGSRRLDADDNGKGSGRYHLIY